VKVEDLAHNLLGAAGDEDVGALGGEPPGGGQADAVVAPGDDRDFALQLLPFMAIRPPMPNPTVPMPPATSGIAWSAAIAAPTSSSLRSSSK
jgi:hypothetical protein